MTNKLIAIFTTLSILLTPLHSYADKDGKGPSDRAYENTSDNASFSRDHKNKDKQGSAEEHLMKKFGISN